MHSIRNLRRWTATALICLLVIINTSTVIAVPGEAKPPPPNDAAAPTPSNNTIATVTTTATATTTCKQCPISTCPPCPQDQICVSGFTTCTQCPQPRCENKKTVSSLSPGVGAPTTEKPGNSNAKLIPAVIGSVFGIAVLAAAMFGYARFRKQRGMGAGLFGTSKCARLDDSSTKEWSMTSLSANVIPIAYIPPPSTPVTPTTPPEAVHQRQRASSISIGTTPLASPLPRPYSTASDNPFASNEDEEVGTIVQATRGTSPLPGTATATATVVTATRAKPALVRLNTIKSNNGSATDLRSLRSAYSGGASIPVTPKTPLTANSLLSVHSTTSSNHSSYHGDYSELDFPLQADGNMTVSSQTDELGKLRNKNNNLNSSNNYNNNNDNNRDSGFTGDSDRYSSPFVDGSSTTYDNGSMLAGNTTSLQLQRESMLSSVSSDPRSTFMSDMTRDGDGEIMIFWGGSSIPGMGDTDNEASLTDKDKL